MNMAFNKGSLVGGVSLPLRQLEWLPRVPQFRGGQDYPIKWFWPGIFLSTACILYLLLCRPRTKSCKGSVHTCCQKCSNFCQNKIWKYLPNWIYTKRQGSNNYLFGNRLFLHWSGCTISISQWSISTVHNYESRNGTIAHWYTDWETF